MSRKELVLGESVVDADGLYAKIREIWSEPPERRVQTLQHYCLNRFTPEEIQVMVSVFVTGIMEAHYEL